MKKLLLTLATLALIAPLGACSKADASNPSSSEQPTTTESSSSEADPTAADLIENYQAIMYIHSEDAKVIDDEHLTQKLPKREQFGELQLKIKVRGEETTRTIGTADFSIVGEYDDTKVWLREDDDNLIVSGPTSFTLKAAFHFADTDEDVEKQWTISWELPDSHIIEINAYDYGSVTNYGLSYSDLNPSAIAEGTPNGVMLQMNGGGSYGWAVHTALSCIRSVTIEFERLGVFSSVQVWGSKEWGTYVEKTGDVKINKVRDDVVDNKLTFDFSEKLVEFDGGDYYLKLWFWNSADLGEGQSSLVKSVSFEVVPSL